MALPPGTRPEGATVGSREHEAVGPWLREAGHVFSKAVGDRRRDGHRAVARLRLGRVVNELALDLDRGLDDPDLSAEQVNPPAAKARQLAEPQPAVGVKEHEGLVAVCIAAARAAISAGPRNRISWRSIFGRGMLRHGDCAMSAPSTAARNTFDSVR